MPKQLFDAEGKAVGEIADDLDLLSLTERARKAGELEAEIKALEDKNVGLKSLREANERKEAKIAELSKQLEAIKPVEKPVEKPDEEKYREIARAEASKAFLENEFFRATSDLTPEERQSVKKFYDKVTHGEVVNADTLPVFLAQAQTLALPDRPKSRPITSGRPPHTSTGERKNFADTEEGKALSARLGFKEPKKK